MTDKAPRPYVAELCAGPAALSSSGGGGRCVNVSNAALAVCPEGRAVRPDEADAASGPTGCVYYEPAPLVAAWWGGASSTLA